MWKKIKSAQEQKNTFRIKKELWIPVFVLMIGLVVLVNIGIRADSSQRELILQILLNRLLLVKTEKFPCSRKLRRI